MKKIILSVIVLAFSQLSMGQDAADKAFQAGLVAGFGFNFQDMGTKYVAKNGAGSDLLIGGAMNYMFNETIGFTTGVEFEFSTTKFKTGVTPLYYYFNDTKIIGVNDPDKANRAFMLTKRKQNSTYLTIPTMVLFKTNFIGYVRYFGKFGMRHSFLLGQRSNDKGYMLPSADLGDLLTFEPVEEVSNKNMKASNEVLFYRGSIGIGGGAEWNFSGSTCLVAEIGYYYGITPLYYNRSNSYMFAMEEGQVRPVNNKATQGQLQIKVSILF